MKVAGYALIFILAMMWYCYPAGNEFCLHLYTEGNDQQLPFSEEQACISSDNLKCTLLNYIPHSQQKLRCCHENQIDIYYASTVHTIPLASTPKYQTLNDYLIVAVKGSVAEIIPQLQSEAKQKSKTIFALIQDNQLVEYAAIIGSTCELQLSSISSLLKSSLVTLHGAKQGYGLEIPLPNTLGGGSICVKLWPSAQKVSSSTHSAPSFYFCFSQADRSEILCLSADSPAHALLQWPLFDGKYLVRVTSLEKVK